MSKTNQPEKKSANKSVKPASKQAGKPEKAAKPAEKPAKPEKSERSATSRQIRNKPKTAATSGTKCAFEVSVNALIEAFGRINALMSADGIPVQLQNVAFRTDLVEGKLVLQSGGHGSWCQVSVPADVHEKGVFVTNIAIPWLSYGSDTVLISYDSATSSEVSYKANIFGTFVTTGSLKEIEDAHMDLDTSFSISYADLKRVVDRVFFNAGTIEGQEDVLIILRVDSAKNVKSSGISRRGDNAPNHMLRASVFDRQRVAVVKEPCFANSDLPTTSFSSGHLLTFLSKCSATERDEVIKIGFDSAKVIFTTEQCVSLTPAITNELGDPTEDLMANYQEDDALFRFTLDTEKHIAPFVNVLSIQGGPRSKLSSGSDETAGRVKLSLKDGRITLEVSGSVAGGKTSFAVGESQGAGSVTIKGNFITEAMSLIHPCEKARFTVWPRMLRQYMGDSPNVMHCFGTVEER